MNFVGWIDSVPLSLLFVGTIVIIFFSIGAGTLLRRTIGIQQGEGDSTGSVVGATLGLLAFIMAFSFNMAANRLDARKQLFLEEINTIDTTYMRSGLLAERYREQARTELRAYVGHRLKAADDPDYLPQALQASEQIHARLWAMVEQRTAEKPLTIVESLFIQSLNQLMDLHGKRVVVALQYRIPHTIWVGLYAIAILAMLAVGFQFGQVSRRQQAINIMLAGAFAAVITLIADLDRASDGSVTISQEPLRALQKKISVD